LPAPHSIVKWPISENLTGSYGSEADIFENGQEIFAAFLTATTFAIAGDFLQCASSG
jgi:hypothetical protein